MLDVGQKAVKINIAERMAGVENMKEENDKKNTDNNDEIQEEIYPAFTVEDTVYYRKTAIIMIETRGMVNSYP